MLMGSLAACAGNAPAPLRSTQWQVTQLSDGGTVKNQPSRAVDIPMNQAGRIFVVFNYDSVRAASGCVDLMGALSWGDNNTTSIDDVTTKVREGANCFPGDEYTADRLRQALSQQTFSWSVDDQDRLELKGQQENSEDSGSPNLSTAPYLELIADTPS